MAPTVPSKRYTPYYRVRTQKQVTSGLGLEAQRAAVQAFVSGAAQLGGEYVEIESGKKNQRPQLLAAIAEARRVGSTLLIAKLDRLYRNASFILALRDSRVDFVCCDMPDANTLTVGLFAVLAQHERETISKRTKDALATKKARGAQLGTPANLTDAARQQSLLVRRVQLQQHPGLRQAAAFISSRRAQGGELSAVGRGVKCPGLYGAEGGTFNQKQVQRLYERLSVASRESASE